ncbi:hypothetical protein HZD82_27140, partial [Pantoea agglomerans]|uniref:hypothetical protein n=1 Tax=Enterobacter agglomerans TaxID=549 RepID=UPI001A8D25E0
DPNIFAVATGIDEHNNYAMDFIGACEDIKRELPHAMISGGDPNIFAVATGIDEHNNYAMDFIGACEDIKRELPHAMISGG